MKIKIESRCLSDVVVLVPDVFQDTRGFFMETFRKDEFMDNGLPTDFVQEITRGLSRASCGVCISNGIRPWAN
jgi:dTDP-4-dehydrorhamnose 3,5-epimerase-like enzyme